MISTQATSQLRFRYRDRGGAGEEADPCQGGGGEVLPRAPRAGADWYGSDGECPLVGLLVDKCGHTPVGGDPAEFGPVTFASRRRISGSGPYFDLAGGAALSPPIAARSAPTRYPSAAHHRHKLVGLRSRLKTELQHLALNQGVQKKRRLWNEKGRVLLQSLPLQGWKQQRRKDLLQLLGSSSPDRAAGQGRRSSR